MLSLRRIAAGSLHLWKREMKIATPTRMAAPFSTGEGASSSADQKEKKRQREKVDVFEKLRSLTGETIDYIVREEKKKGVSVKKADLFTCAKRLDEDGKSEYALEIFEWMDKKKMKFSPKQLAFYVDLLGKLKGYESARECFKKADPDFNENAPRERNRLVFDKLLDWLRLRRKQFGIGVVRYKIRNQH